MDQFLATVQIGVTVWGPWPASSAASSPSRYLEPALSGAGARALRPARAPGERPGGRRHRLRGAGPRASWCPRPWRCATRRPSPSLVSGAVPAHGPRVALGWCEFLTGSTRLVLRVFGIREAGPRTFVSEEEIKHLVKEGRQQGVLDQTEMEIIHSVFEFTDTPVRKVMVPRPKIFALDADTPPAEVGRADRRERLLPHPGLRGLARQRRRRRLRQGRAAAAREAPAGGDPQDPAPRPPRARDQEGGRAAQGAAEAAHPHGAGGRRARLGERPRDPRGPHRGDRGRDPGRVRLGGAPGRAAARRLPGGRGHGLRGRAARELRDPAAGVGGVRDGGRLHARAARLGAQGRRGRGRSASWRLTVVDVERNRISKVKIEKLRPSRRA